jgi:flagellar protein FlbD
MVVLKKLSKQEFVLNSDLIETLERTPDTVVTLTTGKKLLVLDSVDDVVKKVIRFKQLCSAGPRVVQEGENKPG